jgi:hypothetical protein
MGFNLWNTWNQYFRVRSITKQYITTPLRRLTCVGCDGCLRSLRWGEQSLIANSNGVDANKSWELVLCVNWRIEDAEQLLVFLAAA